MPTYEYACTGCGPFDAVRRIAERDAPIECPQCGAGAERALLTAPAFGAMPAATRAAHAANERSRHEPRLSTAHGSGCGCCTPGRKASPFTRLLQDGSKAVVNRRPWMISH